MPAGSLPRRSLQHFFPALSNIARLGSSHRVLRAVMHARGRRDDGETFMAEICFSTYGTRSGARVAAMILDSSEELRNREESSMQQVLAGSRIAVAAVSHEVRNICGAISVVHDNLSRSFLLAANKDFEALGSLVVALERIAAVDLLQYPESRCEVDVTSVLDDLRIVIAPSLAESEIEAAWDIEPELPAVWAESSTLLQIFLNLTTNSIRVLNLSDTSRKLNISAQRSVTGVSVQFLDNGGGVAHPEQLFRPFQAGAQATGLGLYLSRAFARSFRGDLSYFPARDGACFRVDLPGFLVAPPNPSSSAERMSP